MPDIHCPCGASVTATKTLNGWTTELGSSFSRNCQELASELEKHGRVEMGNFDCKRLSGLVAAKMRR